MQRNVLFVFYIVSNATSTCEIHVCVCQMSLRVVNRNICLSVTLHVCFPADGQPAWVGTRQIVTMTAGAGGGKNSVDVHPPLPRLRPHPPAAGWPAAGAAGPVVEAVHDPETETERGTGGKTEPKWKFTNSNSAGNMENILDLVVVVNTNIIIYIMW